MKDGIRLGPAIKDDLAAIAMELGIDLE